MHYHDVESRGYYLDFINILNTSKWSVNAKGLSLGLNYYGVLILIKDKDNIPVTAKILEEAIKKAEVKYQVKIYDDVGKSNVLLFIGAKPLL